MQVFVQVADQGSFTRAADRMDLPRATVTHTIQQLESRLGVRLLHRTTRRLHPTPEGLALAQQGRVLVEELESLGSGLREAASEVAGTLRVTMSASFGRQYVSPLLPAFLARHPKVRLSVHLSDNVVDLVSEGFDLAIRIGALDDSRLVARRIAPNRRVLCASPDYLRRRGVPQAPADLANHDCLLLFGSGGRQDVWRLGTPEGGEVAVRVHGRFESNFGEVLRDASLAGEGIVVHSLWHVADDLRAGRLVVVLPDFPLATTAISAVMPQRRLVPPRVRAFVEFLTGQFGDDPPWERGLAA
jgi:DNA-binding transcriptional LysR family regulator